MSKATENTPAVFIEETRAYQILQLMLKGKSIIEIGKELGTPEENIRRVISQERLKLTAAMQEMQEQWMGITYARTEWLLSKVLDVIDRQTQGEDNLSGPDKNLLKTALDILKFQKEVVIPDKMDKGDSGLVLNQTFVGGSGMYEEAMKEMQYSKRKKTPIEVAQEEPMQIVASSDMVRLEELAAQFLPKGAIMDSEDESDD